MSLSTGRSVRNMDLLNAAREEMTGDEARTMYVSLLGWVAADVPDDVWSAGVQYAVQTIEENRNAVVVS